MFLTKPSSSSSEDLTQNKQEEEIPSIDYLNTYVIATNNNQLYVDNSLDMSLQKNDIHHLCKLIKTPTDIDKLNHSKDLSKKSNKKTKKSSKFQSAKSKKTKTNYYYTKDKINEIDYSSQFKREVNSKSSSSISTKMNSSKSIQLYKELYEEEIGSTPSSTIRNLNFEFKYCYLEAKNPNIEVTQYETQKENTKVIKTAIKSENNSKTISSDFSLGNKRLVLVFEKIINKVLNIHNKKISALNSNKNSDNNYFLLDYHQSVKYYKMLSSRFSIGEFVSRLSRVLCSNCEVYTLLALITFDNYLKNNPSILIDQNDIYIIIMNCFSVSLKSNSDLTIPSDSLSSITFETSEVIYTLEAEFISKLEYKTVVSEERFNNYKEQLYSKVVNGIL